MSHTARQYGTLEVAYDHFNAALWHGKLPPCLITLQRHRHFGGYFRGDGFIARAGDGKTDEIALNPVAFVGHTDRDIMSILVHEMSHLWHHHNGKPGRRGYHNKEWAAEMERIGLMPSDTGAPGGKRVGQRMSHYIMDGGTFDVAASLFLADHVAVEWASARGGADGKGKAAKASAKSKTKSPASSVARTLGPSRERCWRVPTSRSMAAGSPSSWWPRMTAMAAESSTGQHGYELQSPRLINAVGR